MEESFGVIPLKEGGRVFIVHHQKGHWGFPKGHREPGETPKESASRELFEETGLKVVSFTQDPPILDHYHYEKGEKRVTYFLAKVEGKVALQKEEIQEGLWLSLSEAKERLTYEGSKQVCQKVSNLLSLRS